MLLHTTLEIRQRWLFFLEIVESGTLRFWKKVTTIKLTTAIITVEYFMDIKCISINYLQLKHLGAKKWSVPLPSCVDVTNIREIKSIGNEFGKVLLVGWRVDWENVSTE